MNHNMADRIQALRKAKGLSQEALADQLGVSRQAVSKWESGQSVPDLDNIVLMSDLFAVSTDYILKGGEPPVPGNRDAQLTGRILYIASTFLIAIGLFCAFGDWHEEQTMESVWGGMIIQATGAAGYFIGRAISAVKAPLAVIRLNFALALFMPVSMLSGYLSILLFRHGWIAPYPDGILQSLLFAAMYAVICAAGWSVLKKQRS